VSVATAILTVTLAHEKGGKCVVRHVSWIGTKWHCRPVLCPTAYAHWFSP